MVCVCVCVCAEGGKYEDWRWCACDSYTPGNQGKGTTLGGKRGWDKRSGEGETARGSG